MMTAHWVVGLAAKTVLSQGPLGLSALLATGESLKNSDFDGLDMTLKAVKKFLDDSQVPWGGAVRTELRALFSSVSPHRGEEVERVRNKVTFGEDDVLKVEQRDWGEIRDTVLTPLAWSFRGTPAHEYDTMMEGICKAHQLSDLPQSPREEFFMDHLLKHPSWPIWTTRIFWKRLGRFVLPGQRVEKVTVHRLYADWLAYAHEDKRARSTYAEEGQLWLRMADEYLDAQTFLDRVPYAGAEDIDPVVDGAAHLFLQAVDAFHRAYLPKRVQAIQNILDEIAACEGDLEKQLAILPRLIRFLKHIKD